MEAILAAFADRIMTVPESDWTKLTHPIQMTVRGQSIPVQVFRQDAIDCIKRRLGPNATAQVERNGLSVTFTEGGPGNPPSTKVTLPGFYKTGIAIPDDLKDVNTGPLVITKTGGSPYLKIAEAIQKICWRPSESAIQKQIAAREGRKAYRAMLGWQGPAEPSSASSSSSSAASESARRRELPEEVAKYIAKFAAVKKIDGGRKKTQKPRKTRKSRKTTRRR